MSSVGVALVGAGPWGLNLARVLAAARGAELRWICDGDAGRLEAAGARHPGVRLTRDAGDLLADGGVGAVVVAVDSPRHHAVAKRALEAGRHVLVEKPMALSVSDAGELVALARARDLRLMVGHVLLYHPAIVRARELVAAGALGEVIAFDATRVAFGTVRPGESVWWSVGPHDVSLALHLLGDVPATVSATAAAHLQPGRPDMAFATLRFGGGALAHIHVSWLAPAKHRALTVVGTRAMLTFDEGAAARPLAVHDRRVEAGGLVARAGGVEAPDLPAVEPLLAECEHFVACVARGEEPRSNGRHALDVTRVLEAGERSMRAGGAPVEVA